MKSFLRGTQHACRAALRPLAQFGRYLLTPPNPPQPFVWHSVATGPAQGAELLLPQGSAIAESLVSGNYEPEVVATIEKLVDPDDVCFDIGGHYGYLTLVLARVASCGHVHTFEPVPEHAERIDRAASRNQLTHVTVHQQAMAGTVGRMSLRRASSPEVDDSMAYLDEYGGVDSAAAKVHYENFTSLTVPTVTLDSVADSFPPPRFIKLDAEGAEAPILEAGRNLISSNRPRLLIEIHGIVESLRCAEILQSLNYRAILLSDQKSTLSVLWTPRDDHEAFARIEAMLGRKPIVLFQTAAP